MSDRERKDLIKGILVRHEGRGRAITARELCGLVGLPDRQLRLYIDELIDEGLPVISATEQPAGYFIPLSLDEARQYTCSLRSRAIEIFLRRRKVMKNAALYLKPASQGRLI